MAQTSAGRQQAHRDRRRAQLKEAEAVAARLQASLQEIHILTVRRDALLINGEYLQLQLNVALARIDVLTADLRYAEEMLDIAKLPPSKQARAKREWAERQFSREAVAAWWHAAAKAPSEAEGRRLNALTPEKWYASLGHKPTFLHKPIEAEGRLMLAEARLAEHEARDPDAPPSRPELREYPQPAAF